MRLRVLGALMRPSAAKIHPRREEGAGNAGCLSRTHSLVCIARSTQAYSPQVQPSIGIPCATVYGLFRALLGAPGCLATVACGSPSASLTPASGCQNHASLPSAARVIRRTTRSRPSLPASRFVTMRIRPSCRGGMSARYAYFPISGKTKFVPRRCDGSNRLESTCQFLFFHRCSRTGKGIWQPTPSPEIAQLICPTGKSIVSNAPQYRRHLASEALPAANAFCHNEFTRA
jgi:hypothetical protein